MNDSEIKEKDADFLHFYQTSKFQENSDDKFVQARAKRMQLVFNNLQSLKHKDEYATNFLLNRDLHEYANIVDRKDGLNNYAEYINELINQSPTPPLNHCKKWKSNLKNSFDSILRTLNAPDITKREEMSDEKLIPIFTNFKEHFEKSITSTSTFQFDDEQKMETDQLENTSSFNKIPIPRCASREMSNESNFMPHKIETIGFVDLTKRETPKKPSFIPHKVETIGFIDLTKRETPNNQSFMSHSVEAILEIDVKNKRTSLNELEEPSCGFRTAKTELQLQNFKKYTDKNAPTFQPKETAVKRSLGSRSRSAFNKFVPPIKNNETKQNIDMKINIEDERLQHLDPKLIELVKNEIMDTGNPISWDDIAGLQFAKTTIQEIVVWPLLRPDIFTGLRRPPKGILLFGPPGTGKTLIGKCIASQSSSTFFSISASSLTSKWIGESEKLVRTLFSVARCYQPAVIFIDEIDSLLSQRSETEHESSRRVKTEFLVQLDGATTHEDDRILVIGATNRPQELDEAARRRLVKRLYIPLPELEARCQIVGRLMKTEKNELTAGNIDEIAELTDGYSGADMKNLCQEASLGPIRSIDFGKMGSIETHEVRSITLNDFKAALKYVRSSVSPSDLNQYLEWDKVYGSSGN